MRYILFTLLFLMLADFGMAQFHLRVITNEPIYSFLNDSTIQLYHIEFTNDNWAHSHTIRDTTTIKYTGGSWFACSDDLPNKDSLISLGRRLSSYDLCIKWNKFIDSLTIDKLAAEVRARQEAKKPIYIY